MKQWAKGEREEDVLSIKGYTVYVTVIHGDPADRPKAIKNLERATGCIYIPEEETDRQALT